jgi:DNA invertase Pin-like site-specific DNA recombinase
LKGAAAGRQTGRLVFHIFRPLAEFGRDVIRERTKAGVEAPWSGKKSGRSKSLDAEQRKLAVDPDEQRKYAVEVVCRTLTISNPTCTPLFVKNDRAADTGMAHSTLGKKRAVRPEVL